MGLIAISRGSYSLGKEVAEKTADRLGYDCVSREVLLRASEEYNVPEIKLTHAVEQAPVFWKRFTKQRRKYITYIRAALMNYLKRDNVVYHGFACHFFVKDLPRVFNVRVISDMEDRARMVMKRDGVSRREAFRRLKKVDEQRSKWGKKLYGIDPGDPGLYDMVLHIGNITVSDAVDTICRTAGLKRFQTTPESKREVEDLAIAAQVWTFLVGVKQAMDVCIDKGHVILKTETPVTQDSDLVNRMGEIAKGVPGIKGIEVVTEKGAVGDAVCLTESADQRTEKITSTYFE
jgi:cytidylate kinase